MLLEDLHWADRASLDVLALVLGHVASCRVLVVATTRPDWDGATTWPGTGRRDLDDSPYTIVNLGTGRTLHLNYTYAF